MAEKDNEHPEYEGTGRLNSAVGRGVVEGGVATAIGTGIGLGVGALVKRPGAGAAVGAGLAAVVGGIHGGVKGYQSARDGKEQHETNQDMIAQLRAENAGLREQMAAPVEHVEGPEKPAKTPGQPEAAKEVSR